MKITLRIKNPQVAKQIRNILATIPEEGHNAFWMTGVGMALAVRSKVASQEDYARMVDGILNNDILIIPKGGKVEMAEDGMSGTFSMSSDSAEAKKE